MSTSSNSELNINDPVFVQVGPNQLEGVVAYVGSVEFAEGSEWVGVRLTGTSAGKGKNNGEVQGRRYFEVSGENGGVFVKKKSISKRVLTRLEELRLKRELKQQRPSSSSVTSPLPSGVPKATPVKTSRSPLIPPRTLDKSSTPASVAARRKLDELREKRAAVSTSPVPGCVTRRSKPVLEDSTISTPIKVSTEVPVTPNASKLSNNPLSKESPKASPASSLAARLEEMKARSSTTTVSSSSTSIMAKKYSSLLAKYEELEEENKSLKDDITRVEQVAEDSLTNFKQQQLRLDEAIDRKYSNTNEEIVLKKENDALHQRVMSLENELNHLQSNKDNLERSLSESLRSVQDDLDDERRCHQDEVHNFQEKLSETNNEIAILKSQAAATADQAATRATIDVESYKEKAKMQAEVASLRRRINELENNEQESESALEELTLDKEQLIEEKDALEEKIEELNLDLEAARLEAEEAQVELEEVNAHNVGFGGGTSIVDDMNGTEGAKSNADTDDVLKSLSSQNSRLREAILRLREQSNIEKVELSSKLRVSEKEATLGRQLVGEVENLRTKRSELESENRELKETIDVSSAFEGIVEDLSDRILSLEDDNAALRQSIYELEEATELATEMEEVQSEELKTLNKELESKDVKIINLEEAIKMQRRREDDFQKSIMNYRSSIQTLKEEKDSLLSAIEGSSGEKTELVQASQKAMAQAAALVNNTSKMKKLDMSSIMDRLKAQSYELRARRMEELLPEECYGEVSSIKAEILLSDVASKASLVLEHISNDLATSSDVNTLNSDENEASQDYDSVNLDDLILKSKLALLSSRISFVAQRLLHDMFLVEEDDNQDAGFSSQVIYFFSSCGSHLDSILGMLLEENVMESCVTSLGEHLAQIQNVNIPGIEEVMPGTVQGEQSLIATTALRSCFKLLSLLPASAKDIVNDVSDLQLKLGTTVKMAESYYASINEKVAEEAEVLLQTISTELTKERFFEDADVLLSLVSSVDALQSEIKDLDESNQATPGDKNGSDLLRSNKFSWKTFIHCMQKFYPTHEWSFQYRASMTRDRISSALENEAKLDDLQTKLEEARKTLSTRNMELSMQSKRINELDSLLKQTTTSKQSAQVKNISSTSFVLKEKENKMLTEAMEVLQSQVDEYEAQIRAFKDQPKQKSPSKRSSSRRSSALFSMDELFDSNVNAEAAVFRPALRDAMIEASRWRGKFFCNVISELPPLPSTYLSYSINPVIAQPQEGGVIENIPNDTQHSLSECIEEISIAAASVRQTKANVMCVDLSKKNGRSSLRKQRRNVMNATCRFEAARGEATSRLRQILGGDRGMIQV